MQLQIFSLFDKKGGFYTAPFFVRAEGEASRLVAQRANDPQHPIGQFPDDFALYHLGSFDDQSGEMNLMPKPDFRHHVSDFVRKTESQPKVQ